MTVLSGTSVSNGFPEDTEEDLDEYSALVRMEAEEENRLSDQQQE